jgi:hypothetical protein
MTRPQLSEARLGQARVRTPTRQREAAPYFTAVVEVKAEARHADASQGLDREREVQRHKVPVDTDYSWRFDPVFAKYNNYPLILYYPNHITPIKNNTAVLCL